jgi:hypothetical protein
MSTSSTRLEVVSLSEKKKNSMVWVRKRTIPTENKFLYTNEIAFAIITSDKNYISIKRRTQLPCVCLKINCVITENFHVHIWNLLIRIDLQGQFPYTLRVDYCHELRIIQQAGKRNQLKACGRNKDSSCSL